MWANKSTYRKHTMTITDLVVSTLPWSRLLWPFSRLYSHFVAVHELVDTDFGLVVVDVKLDVLVHFPFLIRERSHSLPNPRNQDLTTGADKCVCTWRTLDTIQEYYNRFNNTLLDWLPIHQTFKHHIKTIFKRLMKLFWGCTVLYFMSFRAYSITCFLWLL